MFVLLNANLMLSHMYNALCTNVAIWAYSI